MMSFLSNFHYSVLGTNTQERVVFVHGLMAFAANWRKIASRMENDFQCLIYDQRGHGRSFKPEHGYSPEIFAEDLDKITTELGWDRFHLVGHSMGGRNVMVFAHMFPDKVRTLTIEDMGPEADSQMLDYYKNMLDLVPTPFASKDAVKSFFESDFKRGFKSKEPPTVLATFLQANIEEKNSGLYDWRFSKKAIYEIVHEGHIKDRWLEVSSFKMPVLLIRGEKSHIFKHETYEKMLAVNPNIQGVEIAGAGHWIHYEKYEEFERILRQFITSNNA
ncbi:MAG: alpha/beta fold hydrolase [Pseudobdellovibrio sp.]